MDEELNFKELQGKNINFLFGSGISAGYIPTLWIEELKTTYEDALSNCDEDEKSKYYNYYYNNVVKKAFLNDAEKVEYEDTLNDYIIFLEKLLRLQNMMFIDHDKTINIFTTNYDLFFEKATDEIISKGEFDFKFNDGGEGHMNRRFSLVNYDRKILNTGLFSKIRYEIPTINLYKIHGSVSWERKDDNINIKYDKKSDDWEIIRHNSWTNKLDFLNGKDNADLNDFMKYYNDIAIVNPTKRKFEETLLDENYYHLIRTLSYSLEKDNTILIVFGFSFADEHIREIIKRNLKNPSLMIYIYYFSERNYNDEFVKKKSNNFLLNSKQVKFIGPEKGEKMKFDVFIERVFKDKKVEENE